MLEVLKLVANNKEYMKKYYQEHKEQYKEYYKRLSPENKEHKLEYNKKYRIKNREKEKERSKIYYRNNREKEKERKKQHLKESHQYLNNYKLSKGCSICGYNKCPESLCFHHNGNKEFSLNLAHCRSLEKVKKEMEKCTILCMNCHQELHTQEGVEI